MVGSTNTQAVRDVDRQMLILGVHDTDGSSVMYDIQGKSMDDTNPNLDLPNAAPQAPITDAHSADGEQPIDHFITAFLQRHQISTHESETDTPEGDDTQPEQESQTQQGPNLKEPSSEANQQDDESKSPTSNSTSPPAVARRPIKPSESVGDMAAMRQLANSITESVLESHGRLIFVQQGQLTFVSLVAALVVSISLSMFAKSTFSFMFFGATASYCLAVYLAWRFFRITRRLFSTA